MDYSTHAAAFLQDNKPHQFRDKTHRLFHLIPLSNRCSNSIRPTSMLNKTSSNSSEVSSKKDLPPPWEDKSRTKNSLELWILNSINFNHHNLAKIIAIKKINKNLAWTRVWTSNLNPSSQVSQYKPPKPTITTTTTTTTISSSHHSTPWPIQTSPKILHLTQTNNHSIRSHLVPSQLTS